MESYYHPKFRLNFKDYTIEYILPQNPNISKEWMKSLGPNYQEIYNKYVNNIGNLTLTTKSALLDLSFEEKQNTYGGFKDSPLCLNKYLSYLPDWNEKEIIKRAELLADLSIQAWPYPKIDKKTLEKYIPQKPKNPGEYNKNLQHQLFATLENEIFKLGKNIKKNPTLTCTTFKTNKNFVYTYTQTVGIKIELLMPSGMLKDPENKVKILPKIEYNNKVTYLFKINSIKDISYAMELIKQSYDYINSKYEINNVAFNSNNITGKETGEYSLDSYKLLHYHLDLFKSLENEIYGLGNDIERKFNKHYIAFKSFTNFVDITPQKGALRITLNMPFGEVNDPEGIGRDISNVGHWENGDFFFKISSINGLDYAMFLIKQSYDYIWNDKDIS
ncbi:DUF5655 domain-containing protein [Methanobrevibacter sp. UBA412]|uniref:DUF5655 domain-containing protein n=1 Tax=Methanobrevibacter sp. UBA412 TaxID=1915486 RepID=UPI0039B90BB8